MEQWLPISDFPKYEVSNTGRIRNERTGKILKPGKNPKGYSIVCLHKDNAQHTRKVHRLVADAFCDNSQRADQVNHKDGDKNNNHSSNLEWCTGSDNILHAYSSGLRKPPHTKKVKVVETGETFDSMSDCARHIDGTVSGIYDCLTGRQSTHRGYHFEWMEDL